MKAPHSIQDYIRLYPVATQKKLRELRATIKKVAPKSVESIAYGMPSFKQHKYLVHFAAYNNHIGFYPTPSAIKVFAKELSRYVTSKGAVQFPLDEKLPLGLIKRIVKYRVGEDLVQAKKQEKH